MTALLLSDATASAALSRLLHDWTGCAIPSLADTPESEVEELVPLCLSILRRHWTTPLTALGDGNTPMSLADLLRRLIGDRVQGNEALCIPPANADIPTAVAALRDRDMSSGLTLTLTDGTDGSTPTTTSLPDGLSLAQLLCGVSPDGSDLASSVTELHDSNKGWVMSKRFNVKTYFPQCEKMELGCKDIDVTFDYNGGTVFGSDAEYHLPNLKVIHPETISVGFGHGVFDCAVQTHDIYMPELERIESGSNFGLIRGISSKTRTEPFALYAPKLRTFNNAKLFQGYNPCQTGIEKVVLGAIDSAFAFANGNLSSPSGMGTPNLVHLEFGQGTSASLDLKHWIPTTALSERLPEFLSNFKTYIAQRLTDKGSGLTIYLSQAVRDAIQTDPEIVNIITSKGWTISPAPSV